MRFIIFFWSICFFLSCTDSIDKKLSSLNDGEAYAYFEVNGKSFYNDTTLFKGSVFKSEESFTIHLFGNDQSNVMVSLALPKDQNQKFEVKIGAKNQLESDLMFGKISQEIQGTGIGYIITEGTATISKFNKNEIAITFKGKCTNIKHFDDKTRRENLSGFLVFKTPDIKE